MEKFYLRKLQNGNFSLQISDGSDGMDMRKDLYDYITAKKIAINWVWVKAYSKDFKVDIELIDETQAPQYKCEECDSLDVETKGWINHLTGETQEMEDLGENDMYCNDCGKHTNIVVEKGRTSVTLVTIQ